MAGDVGKRVVIPYAYDLTDYIPDGINNPGNQTIVNTYADIAARDAGSNSHNDFVEVTDPSADPNVPWSGAKAHYLNSYGVWVLVKYRGNFYADIASITDVDTVELDAAVDFNVDYTGTSVVVGYGTDNLSVVNTIAEGFPNQFVEIFFPNNGGDSAYFITPNGASLNLTNGNVRLYGHDSIVYLESKNSTEYLSFPNGGRKNIVVDGLIFKSWADRIDSNSNHADFNSSNLDAFRLRTCENVDFQRVEFHDIAQSLVIKEPNKTDTTRTTNVTLRNFKTVNGVQPLFFQQIDGLQTDFLDIHCALTGDGQHHIYANNAVENWSGENIFLRGGQGYALQLQGVEGGVGNKAIKNVKLQNILFDDVYYGLIAGGAVENVNIIGVKGTKRTDLSATEGLWININGTAADAAPKKWLLQTWEIDGGAWYDEVASGNDFIEDITLDNFTVSGMTRYGIKWRFAKALRLINSRIIIDPAGTGNIIELLCAVATLHKFTARNNYLEITGGNGNTHMIKLDAALQGIVDISFNEFIQTTSFASQKKFINLVAGHQGKGTIFKNRYTGGDNGSGAPDINFVDVTNLDLDGNLSIEDNRDIDDPARPLFEYELNQDTKEITQGATLNLDPDKINSMTVKGTDQVVTALDILRNKREASVTVTQFKNLTFNVAGVTVIAPYDPQDGGQPRELIAQRKGPSAFHLYWSTGPEFDLLTQLGANDIWYDFKDLSTGVFSVPHANLKGAHNPADQFGAVAVPNVVDDSGLIGVEFDSATPEVLDIGDFTNIMSGSNVVSVYAILKFENITGTQYWLGNGGGGDGAIQIGRNGAKWQARIAISGTAKVAQQNSGSIVADTYYKLKVEYNNLTSQISMQVDGNNIVLESGTNDGDISGLADMSNWSETLAVLLGGRNNNGTSDSHFDGIVRSLVVKSTAAAPTDEEIATVFSQM